MADYAKIKARAKRLGIKLPPSIQVGGARIIPKWNWSKGYRACVTQILTALRRIETYLPYVGDVPTSGGGGYSNSAECRDIMRAARDSHLTAKGELPMKIYIKDRFSGAALFTADLDARFDTASDAVRLSEAAKIAGLRGANLSRAYLSRAYLSGADLRGADLSGAYLRGADLSRAYLSGADLNRADLSGADLSRAHLSGADLSRADLSGADLSRADLSRADLSGADLSRADLRGIKISRLLARVTRIVDPYEFMVFRAEDGRCVIVAGCRGPWTVAEYRKHVKTYDDPAKEEETSAILDFIEARDKADAKAAKKVAKGS